MQNLNKSIDDANKSTTKLRDNLDKVDTKVQDITISAKDIVKVLDTKFLTIMKQIVLETSKLSGTITELHSHVNKVIEENVKAGEKLAEKMEESSEKNLSILKVKAMETSDLMASIMNKIGDKKEEQSTKLAQQIEINSNLLEKRSDEIAKKYNDKEIGLFNLKKHKENTKGHIDELKKYKIELEAATLHTALKYDLKAMQYDKDSAEFKKAQEDKAAALLLLQAKTKEVDKTLKESNDSYLAVWKKQHGTIKTELDGLEDKITDGFTKNTYGFENFVKGLGDGIIQLKSNIDTLDTKEKELNKAKYDKKSKKLEEELAKVREDVTKHEKEKARLEKEQADAKALTTKYREDITKIKAAFEPKKEEGSNNTNKVEGVAGSNTSASDEDNKKPLDTSNWLGSEEQKTAAADRIEELEKLAVAQEKVALYTDVEKETSRAAEIEKANQDIINSERSVLLEQMRIEDEKVKLAEEKAKKDAEIEEKTKKRKEKLEKLEKIKAKAQHVVDIAKAVGSVAKGVATAWAYGPFIGPPMAALVAIQGALQIKTMTEQLKYMEDGGLLNGKRHSQGGMRIQGTNIEVEGGEYVVNRESTNKNLGLINYINSQRKELGANDLHSYFGQPFSVPTFTPPFSNHMEKGGQVPSFEPNVDILNSELLAGIQQIKIEPRVSVTDINTVHDNMVKVDEWTGI